MEIIHHRRNTISLLKSTSIKYGIEVDIRSFGKDLIIHHDPYCHGEKFAEWLKHYNHQFLIINVKEEGLEEKILIHLEEAKITRFFFLDQSYPTIIKAASLGKNHSALRVSEFESIETALILKNKIDWIWIDTYTKLSLTVNDYQKLKSANFKLCLVSPEINQNNLFDIKEIKDII